MAEASTGESQSQSGASAAKQMLAALTRHSQEISRRFADSCDFVSRLNATLENKVNGRLADINETAEQIVRAQLENLLAEKDSVLAELTELRQEELKVLQNIGKELRDALSERLKELLAALKTQLEEKMAAFKESLQQTENEVTLAVDNLRKGLDEKVPDHIDAIVKKAEELKKDLEALQSKQKEMQNQESSLSSDTMVMHCDELKGNLEQMGEDYLKSIDELVSKLLGEQKEKLEQRTQVLAKLEEQAHSLLKAEVDSQEKLLNGFATSCQQIADLRVNLHSSSANNVALIYRTELLSIAQETEDQLVIVRSHLHTVLRNYHDFFAEQANNLVSKFELSAKEALPAKSAADTAAEQTELPEEVDELFKKLRTEVVDKSKEVFTKADVALEESLNEFRNRLSQSGQKASSLVEAKLNEFRKEISDTAEANKAQLEEMASKANALEQLIEESNELISALDQSNLEF